MVLNRTYPRVYFSKLMPPFRPSRLVAYLCHFVHHVLARFGSRSLRFSCVYGFAIHYGQLSCQSWSSEKLIFCSSSTASYYFAWGDIHYRIHITSNPILASSLNRLSTAYHLSSIFHHHPTTRQHLFLYRNLSIHILQSHPHLHQEKDLPSSAERPQRGTI